MSLKINTNNVASEIFTNASMRSNVLSKLMNKLSSGLAINSAADDPAGLVISEQMKSRIASLNVEIENITTTINKYETASSSAMQLRGILTEARSLAVAAANGAVNDPAITEAYQAEADRLVDTYNRIVETSSFGNQKLFDGSEGSITTVAELASLDLSSLTTAEEEIAYIDEEIARLDSEIVNIGATQKNDLESRRRNLEIEAQNLQAAQSQIADTDYASTYANFVKNSILLESSMALMSHAFIAPKTTLSLLMSE